MSPDMDLTLIWAFIILFAVFAYVVMDGFDLGIGILFPVLRYCSILRARSARLRRKYGRRMPAALLPPR